MDGGPLRRPPFFQADSKLALLRLRRTQAPTDAHMGRTTTKNVDEPPSTPPRKSFFFCCCGSAVDDLAQEVQLQVRAARAPAPLELQHGYANEENEKRGMAAPKFGAFEVVNKNRQGEIIGVRTSSDIPELSLSAAILALSMRRPWQVLVALNAEELVVKRRDPNGDAPPVYGQARRSEPGTPRAQPPRAQSD